jgi:lactate dehydrogenase-like 2-hydroxyacid dehydrogenase
MTRISLLVDSPGAIAVAAADLLFRTGDVGGRVQEAATGESLESRDGRVAVAALDVRAAEPSNIPTGTLAGPNNSTATPHIASASIETIADLATQSVDCLLTLLEHGGRIELRSSHA